jgi:glycosyltransferase involved in cell wall biosynthesis
MHFAGSIGHLVNKPNVSWNETLWCVNSYIPNVFLLGKIPTYIKTVQVRTPFIEMNQCKYDGPRVDDCITLINANSIKGIDLFIKLAMALPDKKFLAVRGYYQAVPYSGVLPPNLEWIDFTRDIKSIYKRTRILLVTSKYESFCVVAVEAMANGIPVIYTRPYNAVVQNMYGTTEGMREWISPVGIDCDMNNADEWISEINRLDDPEVYNAKSKECIEHSAIYIGTASSGANFVAEMTRLYSVPTNTMFRAQNQAFDKVIGPSTSEMLVRPSQPVGWRGGKLTFGRR